MAKIASSPNQHPNQHSLEFSRHCAMVERAEKPNVVVYTAYPAGPAFIPESSTKRVTSIGAGAFVSCVPATLVDVHELIGHARSTDLYEDVLRTCPAPSVGCNAIGSIHPE